MNQHALMCLDALDALTRPNGEMCVPFAPICHSTEMERPVVRRLVRWLARKGYAEFYRGLLTEDGYPAGAGYCITQSGIAYLQEAAGE